MKVQNYSIEEIFEKNLLFLIPFYLFSYEQYFAEYDGDVGKLSKLTSVYEGIVEKLDQEVIEGVIDEYTRLTIIDMSKKVLEHLAKKYSNITEKVGAVMGGKILDYEAKDILNAGKKEGRLEAVRIVIKTARKYNADEEEIVNLLMTEFEISEEEAKAYLTQNEKQTEH